MPSDEDIKKELFLQTDDYPTPSSLGPDTNGPSTTPALPQADLASILSDEGKGDPS